MSGTVTPKLHFVHFGRDAWPTNPGQIPPVAEVEATVALAKEKGIICTISLVDSTYLPLIRKLSIPTNVLSPEQTQEMEQLAPFVLSPTEDVPAEGVKQMVRIRPLHRRDFLRTFAPGADEVVVYILADPTVNSTYAAIDYVEDGLAFGGTRFFLYGQSRPSFSVLLQQWLNGQLPSVPSNLYAGSPVKAEESAVDTAAGRILVRSGALCLAEYFRCSFHLPAELPKQSGELPSWVLNVESAPVKGFILYYHLYPEVQDRTPHREMLESGDYRAQLTKLMAAALAHYVVDRKVLPVEQVAALGGWHAEATWRAVAAKLSS